MNNNVVMIKREFLHPHPDNPRKDLGDLAELTESIKEHGVMQNLTVVPDGDKYKVLIGHRRLSSSSWGISTGALQIHTTVSSIMPGERTKSS